MRCTREDISIIFSCVVEGGSGHQEFASFVLSLTGPDSSLVFAQNKKGMTNDFCDNVMEKNRCP